VSDDEVSVLSAPLSLSSLLLCCCSSPCCVGFIVALTPPKKNTFDHYRNFKDTMATGFKDTMATGFLQAAVLQGFSGMIEHARLPHHFKSDRVLFHNPAHSVEGFEMSMSCRDLAPSHAFSGLGLPGCGVYKHV